MSWIYGRAPISVSCGWLARENFCMLATD